MHQLFRELLDRARGETAFVVAANLDIRGFSAWSQRVESPDTTLYLRKLYPKLIDTYFRDEWFFKPTGDGLLLVRPFEEEELPTLVQETLRSSLEIVDTFGSLCRDEPMITFEIPEDVGIGIAQGAASRLVSDDRTLDYSGRVLNLASRLMELARPRGVVFDSRFGAGLIPPDLDARFSAKTGFLRGVSPDDEVTVRYIPELTEIPTSFERRPSDQNWETTSKQFTLKEMEKTVPSWWRFELDHVPTEPGLIKCAVTHDALAANQRRIPDQSTTHRWTEFEYLLDAGQPAVRVDIPSLTEALRAAGLKGPWEVLIKIDYPVP